MTRRTLLPIIAAAFLLSLLLVACDGTRTDADPSSATVASKRVTPAPARPAKQAVAAQQSGSVAPQPKSKARESRTTGAVTQQPKEPAQTFASVMSAARKARRAGQRTRALALYLTAAKLEPKRARPQVEAARLLIRARRLKQARELAESGVALESGWSLAWNTLGRVDLGEGKLAAAEDAFSQATKCKEDNIYAWNNLGLVRIKRQRFAEAVEALQQATAGDGARAFMFNNLGIAYEGLAQVKEALGAYKAGLVMGSGIAGQNFVRLERAQEKEPRGG